MTIKVLKGLSIAALAGVLTLASAYSADFALVKSGAGCASFRIVLHAGQRQRAVPEIPVQSPLTT